MLEEALGRGGYGVCYRAHFRGATVAVKVLYAREHQREAMKDAVEMAVLSHIRHPGIVSVYSCFTDMVEDGAPPLVSPCSLLTVTVDCWVELNLPRRVSPLRPRAQHAISTRPPNPPPNPCPARAQTPRRAPAASRATAPRCPTTTGGRRAT